MRLRRGFLNIIIGIDLVCGIWFVYVFGFVLNVIGSLFERYLEIFLFVSFLGFFFMNKSKMVRNL